MKKEILWISMLIFGLKASGLHGFAQETVNYERDCLTKLYNSENGLEGTVANCIYAAEDGFLWVGGYTGLYCYDGTEFKNYPINGRSLPVNEILQDPEGNLWIGTNGEGIFSYDGKEFSEYPLKAKENGTYIINKLYCDQEGTIWVGTKSGLFFLSADQNVLEVEALAGLVIHDITELSSGEKIIVEKTGRIFRITGDTIEELCLSGESYEGIPRCCSGEEDYFYIGTNSSDVLKVSREGEILERIIGKGLSSFNDISEFQEGRYWVCSDSGIGILQEDGITKLQFPMDDSVEETCTDYQGNFWFASSRQGILQIYENYFSDLGAYWGMESIVNSIQCCGEKIYIGSDEGLYCYADKTPITDRLSAACSGERIRQIYQDLEGRLWVSTYQGGIHLMEKNGTVSAINTENSGLTTNQIRCIWQKQNHEILVGTEEGLFLIDLEGKVQRFVQDEILNSKRILDVKEDSSGKIYAATDGYGVYVVEDGQVIKTYAKQQGMLSGVILKVVPSERMNGVWLVTGEEICFLTVQGEIRRVTGLPAVNSLDLLLTEEGDAIVLAGNGYFRLKEEELLNTEDISYFQLNKQDGLPIDFTANSWNTIQDGTLYMCGTAGACSISLKKAPPKRPIRLYVNKVTADGNCVEGDAGVYEIPASAHRINLDIRPINYVHQKIVSSYFLEDADQMPMFLEEGNPTEISYTNLAGGSYVYQYKVLDGEICLAELSILLKKKYTLWEEPVIRVLLLFLILVSMILILSLIIWIRERHIKKKYRLKFQREKEAELSKLAYRDLITGVYNRNYFEQERERIEVQKIYALFSVSVNHIEYLKNKYGIRYVEKILRRAAQILQESSTENLQIYRVSENGFFFWMIEPVQLEAYIHEIKQKFEQEGKEEEVPLSFSVGAIYNNRVEKETMDELIQRCWKMRVLDEKHAEARFVEGKMKFL